MKTLPDWLLRIEQLHPETIELGLERVARVYANLAASAHRAIVITVAGTNGKGSTVECLLRCLLAQGLKVGSYTSPHLRVFNERICTNGVCASDEQIVAAFDMVERARNDVSLTYFEFTTLAAFEVFHSAQLDVWILEVGLGGRLDAVNIIAPDVAVITSIGLDHRDWLGDTREQIAQEKAGIMRPHGVVVCSDPVPPLAIATIAHNLHCDLRQVGRDFQIEAGSTGWDWQGKSAQRRSLRLPRGVAPDNIAGALAVLEILDALPDGWTLNQALGKWALAGRQQVIPGAVEWWLDVAHNREAAALLAASLEAHPRDGQCFIVVGMLADKPAAELIRALQPCAAAWIVVGLDAARALPPLDLAGILAAQGIDNVCVVRTVAAGCAIASARARAGDRIVVTGSFHTVGPALAWLGL